MVGFRGSRPLIGLPVGADGPVQWHKGTGLCGSPGSCLVL